MDADANRQRPKPQPRSRGRAAQSDHPGDSDYADPGRRSWPAAVAVGVLGLVLGLLAGLLYSATQTTEYEATTSISVLPDPSLDSNDNNTTTQDATAFIQSQLVVVNGAELADQVRSALNLSARPNVEATQVGQTYVVSIVATATSREEAVAVAQRTASGYDTLRTRQLSTNIDSLLTATNRQLTTVSSSLTSSRRNADANDPLTPSQTALQTEYERLLSQRSSLTGVRAQVGGIVTVVAPARETSAGLSSSSRNALVGGLLGVLVALALYILFRRSVRRIRTVADLSTLGLVTILPVQSRRPRRRATRPDTSARLLAARLDPELTTGEPLVFVGVTSGAGADHVSTAVAAALTDRGPVLYLPRPTGDDAGASWLSGLGADPSATDFFELLAPSDVPGVWLPNTPATQDGYHPTRVSRTAHLAAIFRNAQRRGFVVVLEADPISESDMAVDCGRAGASIVLVVARDTSSPADVVVATELFAAQSVTFLGAVLNEAPRLLSRVLGKPGLLAPRTMVEPTKGAHRDRTGASAPVDDEPIVDPEPGAAQAGDESPVFDGVDADHSDENDGFDDESDSDNYYADYDNRAPVDDRVSDDAWRTR